MATILWPLVILRVLSVVTLNSSFIYYILSAQSAWSEHIQVTSRLSTFVAFKTIKPQQIPEKFCTGDIPYKLNDKFNLVCIGPIKHLPYIKLKLNLWKNIWWYKKLHDNIKCIPNSQLQLLFKHTSVQWILYGIW
jgi:hypothetical protein